MPNLPDHIEELLSEAQSSCNNHDCVASRRRAEAKLRAILEAAWGVLWEWDWDVSVGDDLSAAMEKLKEAMSNEA